MDPESCGNLEMDDLDLGDRLARLLGVPEGQGARAARLAATSFFLSAALAALKTAQAGVFLEACPRSMISWAYAGSALLLMALSSVAVSFATRMLVGALTRALLAASIVSLLALRGALALELSSVPFAAYVVIEALSGVLVIQVWSVISAATDARSARRLLPVAGIGAGLAWTLSAIAIRPLVHLTGAEALIVIGVFFLGCTWVCVRIVDQRDITDRRVQRRGSGFVRDWLSGLAFVARSRLMRLMTALAMIALVLEQVMDFHLMATAREELGDAESISAFFGTYYGVTSAIGLLLLVGFSSRVMAALGAARALLVTPLSLVVVAGVATALPGLASAVALRGASRVLKQSIWSSATEQMQTPLPVRRRSQARAVTRGVLAPGAYVLGALALAALPAHFETRWLTLVSALTAALMCLFIWRFARRTYLSSLRRAIDERSFELGTGRALSSEPLDVDTCEGLSRELRTQEPSHAAVAAELLGLSASSAATGALVHGLSHASGLVRATTIGGLERHGSRAAAEALAAHLGRETDADLRWAAARSVRAIGLHTPAVLGALSAGRDDADPRVAAICRAELLAADCSAPGFAEAMLSMLVSDDPVARDAALFSLTREATSSEDVVDALRELLQHSDPEVRVTCARVVIYLGLVTLLPLVLDLLVQPRTAPAVARLLVEIGDGAFDGGATATMSIAGFTRDTGTLSQVRGTRSDKLLGKLLASKDKIVRHQLTIALGFAIRAGDRRALPERVVGPMIDRETRHAYLLLSLLAGLARDDGVRDWEVEEEFAFLAGEVEIRIEQDRRAVLDLLLLLGRQRLVSVVEMGRRGESRDRDAQITELLAAALEPSLARTVVPLFERISLRERVEAGRALGFVSETAIDDPLATIVDLGDPQLCQIAWLTYGERFESRFPHLTPEAGLIPRFERMRFLRTVPMFSRLSGEDLLSVADAVDERELGAADVIFRKGDPGDEFYLIVEGTVRILHGNKLVTSLGKREFFGDLAILDHQPRSADAVCEGAVRLLRLRGADLRGLMATRPQITTEILEVMVRRLRDATARAS